MSNEPRATYAERFNVRAIQRPEPTPVYVRPTDEQISALPEAQRALVYTVRGIHDACREMFRARTPGEPTREETEG